MSVLDEALSRSTATKEKVSEGSKSGNLLKHTAEP